MRYILFAIILMGVFVFSIVYSANKLVWHSSYKTIGFDTLSGDLEVGDYAVSDDGNNYFIREKDDGYYNQFNVVDSKYDISKMNLVKIIGTACYDEFLTDNGYKVRVKSDCKTYPDIGKAGVYPENNLDALAISTIETKEAQDIAISKISTSTIQ